MRPKHVTPELQAALIAAKWAREVGAKPGNLWEPAVARYLLNEWRQLGSDPALWPAIEGIFSARAGLRKEE